jgi:hypothetical protein
MKPWIGTWRCLEQGLEGYLVVTETHFFEVLQAVGRTPAIGDPPTESEAFQLLQTLHARAGTYTQPEWDPDPSDPRRGTGTATLTVEVCHSPGECGKRYKFKMWVDGDTCREQMLYPDKEGEIFSWERAR